MNEQYQKFNILCCWRQSLVSYTYWQFKAVYLNVGLKGEEINMLPVAAIKSNQLPVAWNAGTTAETCHIQIWKNPTNEQQITCKQIESSIILQTLSNHTLVTLITSF